MPKANADKRPPKKVDRRRAAQRRHPGQARPEPANRDEAIHHDVLVETCPALAATAAGLPLPLPLKPTDSS